MPRARLTPPVEPILPAPITGPMPNGDAEDPPVHRMACQHETLRFGSGDYYLFCQDCGAKWCLHAPDRPEYRDGVGAAPDIAQTTIEKPVRFARIPVRRVERAPFVFDD